jgi:RNA polymerase sigma-70 factor (ECF subfamily)
MPTDDDVMIRAFQTGDREAFDRLVTRHRDEVFNLCYRFLGDYEDANDAAQEAFIKAFRGLRKFRFDSAFSTWLYRIAVNTCKNRLNSKAHRQRRRTVALDNPGPDGGAAGYQVRNGSPDPAARLERKERAAMVQRAIDRLDSDRKTVVILRDIQGLAYEEIAAVTGLALGTVKSRIARARADLREKLRSVIDNGV